MSRLPAPDDVLESVLKSLALALRARLAAMHDKYEYFTLKCVNCSTVVDDTAVCTFHARICPERSFAEFEKFSWSLSSNACNNIALDQIKNWRRAVHVLLDRRFWEILNTNFQNIFLIAVDCDAVLCIETTATTPNCKPNLLIYFRKTAQEASATDESTKSRLELVEQTQPTGVQASENAVFSRLREKFESLFRMKV